MPAVIIPGEWRLPLGAGRRRSFLGETGSSASDAVDVGAGALVLGESCGARAAGTALTGCRAGGATHSPLSQIWSPGHSLSLAHAASADPDVIIIPANATVPTRTTRFHMGLSSPEARGSTNCVEPGNRRAREETRMASRPFESRPA